MIFEIRDIGRVLVIIRGGVAGVRAALRLAPVPVAVLATTPLGTEAAWRPTRQLQSTSPRAPCLT
jgi:hypothetical protein